jgi:hypothetical protein
MIKKYLLIALTMSTAFVFSSYAGNHIFISYTPQINNNYLAELQKQLRRNINNVYLAFSNIGWKDVKKDIAITFPTLRSRPGTAPVIRPITNSSVSPTQIPSTNNKSSMVAGVDVLSIPENLFKPLSKKVSAYEAGNSKIILKVAKGTIIGTKKMKLPDGRIVDVLDFSDE